MLLGRDHLPLRGDLLCTFFFGGLSATPTRGPDNCEAYLDANDSLKNGSLPTKMMVGESLYLIILLKMGYCQPKLWLVKANAACLWRIGRSKLCYPRIPWSQLMSSDASRLFASLVLTSKRVPKVKTVKFEPWQVANKKLGLAVHTRAP